MWQNVYKYISIQILKRILVIFTIYINVMEHNMDTVSLGTTNPKPTLNFSY